MNRNKLKSYAPAARREFIQAVTDRAAYYGLKKSRTERVTEQGDTVVIQGRAFPKIVAEQRRKLEERISRESFDHAYEESTNPDWVGWTEKTLDTSGEKFGLKIQLHEKWNSVKLGTIQQGRRVLRRLRKLYAGQVEPAVPVNMRFGSYKDG